MTGTNFKELLKNYDKSKSDDSNKYDVNVTTIQTEDFISTEMFKTNPIIYEDKIWWRWDSEFKRWYMVDDVKIIMEFNNNFILRGANSSIFSSGLRQTILNALKQAGRIFKEQFLQEIKPTWIVF